MGAQGLRPFGGAGSGWGAGRLCFLPWPGERGALSSVRSLWPLGPLVCKCGGPLPGTVSAGCGGRCWRWSACRKSRSGSSGSRKKRNSVSPGGLSGPRHPLWRENRGKCHPGKTDPFHCGRFLLKFPDKPPKLQTSGNASRRQPLGEQGRPLSEAWGTAWANAPFVSSEVSSHSGRTCPAIEML